MIKLLEKIQIDEPVNLDLLLANGYSFVARTRKDLDFYRNNNIYVIYNPRNDEIIKQFTIRK